MTLILASTSAGRLKMLRDAGVDVDPVSPGLDEEPLKQALRGEGASARDLADMLAEAKALKISGRRPETLVLGADQILECEDRTQIDKPRDAEEACAHLRALSGTTHRLVTAAVIAEGGSPIWRHVDIVKLSVRPLSEEFIENYVARHWDDIRHSVGCYRVEREGAQLFSAIEGSQFSIIGLPLLPILDYLRVRGEMPA